MNKLSAAIIVASGAFLSACTGHLYTVLNPDLDPVTKPENNKDKKPATNFKIEGLLAYPVIDVIELYETTALVNEKTGKIEAKTPDCVPERSIKFGTRADYSNPYQIKYEPGLFETNTFGVTLKDGVLVSVNISSDPAKSASAAAELLPFVAAPKVAAADIGKKYCNAQPRLLGVFRAPGIRQYADIPD